MSYCSHGYNGVDCPLCKERTIRTDSFGGYPYRRVADPDDHYRLPPASTADIFKLQNEIETLRSQVKLLEGHIKKLMDIFLPTNTKK